MSSFLELIGCITGIIAVIIAVINPKIKNKGLVIIIGGIVIFICIVGYFGESNKTAFTLTKLEEDHGAGVTKFVYYNNQVYYSPKGCYLQDDNTFVVLENFEIENDLEKEILIQNIYFEVDSYEKTSEPIEYFFYGDAGGLEVNHIYYGNIDAEKGKNTLQYSEDSDEYFNSNNNYDFNFQPKGSHVSINDGEYECFTMALIFKESGLYKFHYSVEYSCGNKTTVIDSPEIVRYISDSFCGFNDNIPHFYGSDTEHYTSNMEELYNLSYEMAEGKRSYDSHFDEVLNNAIADYEENNNNNENIQAEENESVQTEEASNETNLNGEEDVQNFIGCFLDMNDFEPTRDSNANLIQIRFNTDNDLELVRGLYLSTTGTTLYYTYDSYTVSGNTLTGNYPEVGNENGPVIDLPGGTHTIVLQDDSTLQFEGTTWYRTNLTCGVNDEFNWKDAVD